MTKQEFRNSEEYRKCIEKITNYPKDFIFSIYPKQITKAQYNAINIVIGDCIKQGLIESIEIGLNIKAETVELKYKRI